MAAVRPIQLEVGLDGSTGSFDGSGTVCSHIDCFKPALQSRVHASGTVIMAVTNAGFAAFWHNLRCSLERVGLAQHALVVGTDREACSAALAPGVSCLVGARLFWPNEAAAELERAAVSHGTPSYARLMQVKTWPTLEALRLGFNVLTTDTVRVRAHTYTRLSAARVYVDARVTCARACAAPTRTLALDLAIT